jgi:prepilin-type N-terminal cleavage/methylation domain-containing protein
MNRNSSGFTLIELMIVISIIGLLAAMILPMFDNHRDSVTLLQPSQPGVSTQGKACIEGVQYHIIDGQYVVAFDTTSRVQRC